MEIELLEKDKDSIKILIKEADMTLISPLVKELLGDELVTEVKYMAANPDLGFPTLYVKVSRPPQTALKRAAKSLQHLRGSEGKVAKELK
jgi:DNA-directed RNA polymerase subunit L